METLIDLGNEVRIYVGTYAKYNNGNLGGKWVTLNDFADFEEFYEYCKELHSDESDIELMFQDWECNDLFNDFIGESHIDDKVFDILEYLERENIDLNDESGLIKLNNEALSNCNYDYGFIYSLYEFDDVFLTGMSAEDAFIAGQNADVIWSDDYFCINGSGNAESFCNVESRIHWDIVGQYLNNIV